MAEGIDGQHIDRLPELYQRIMNNRRESGMFGNCFEKSGKEPEEASVIGTHFLSGLVNYYALTGDMRALNAAEEAADNMLTRGDAFFEQFKTDGPHMMSAWITEGFAELYRETQNDTYLEAVRRITNECMGSMMGAHSHGYMTTLRGIMRAAIYAKDEKLAAFVKVRRQEILDRGGVMENGDISECFPRSHRNEGCSIADWIMLNLLYGHHYDDVQAYEMAEHALWNALFFNQFVTGGFGHRFLAYRGYRTYIEEAWWCCTQNAGTCFAELARHTVTVRRGRLKLNFLIPGQYTVPTEQGSITVTVTTKFPAKAATIIKVSGTKEEIDLRIPSYIKNVTLRRVESEFGYTLYLDGKMGHYTEKHGDGHLLKYGPLVLAPMAYHWDMRLEIPEKSTVPEGYAHENMPGYQCMLDLGVPDENGFYAFDRGELPDWSVFEEGEMADISGGEAAAAYVPVHFADGSRRTLYFQPLCSATSNLTLMDIPVVFDLA